MQRLHTICLNKKKRQTNLFGDNIISDKFLKSQIILYILLYYTVEESPSSSLGRAPDS